MPGKYHLLPTKYPKRKVRRVDGEWKTEYSKAPPEGWVILGPHIQDDSGYDASGKWQTKRTKYKGILGPVKRKLTEGYLNTRMNRLNSVETNQNYVTRIMENPRTPDENRAVVLEYVRKHSERFVPVDEGDPDSEYGRWARIHNGENVQHGFVARFLRKYGGSGGGEQR